MNTLPENPYGVVFTPEQWAASNVEPPRWDLDPPQRENYDDDQSYILAMRDYADRVIAANSTSIRNNK